MTIIDGIIMGIVQGLTEFLPVSSSGHLVLFSNILGINDPGQSNLLFDALLHLGTLIAVIIAFYKDVIDLIKEFFLVIKDIFTGKFTLKNMTPYRRFLIMIIVSLFPLIFIYPLKDKVETLFSSVLFVGIALLITSVMLYICDKLVIGKKDMSNTSYSNALTVGIFQAVAVAPGISRSGSTITGGLICGFSKEYAFKFSFIMSLPTILAANVLTFKDALEEGVKDVNVVPYIAGVITAAVVGYFSIVLLKYILTKNRFRIFSYYCLAVGLIAIIYSLIF